MRIKYEVIPDRLSDDGKIIKGGRIVTFKPSGNFIQKINTFAKLFHYKYVATFVDADATDPEDRFIDYKLIKTKSKKKHITFLPKLLKQSKNNDCVIYFKFLKKRILRPDKKNKDNPDNFYYYSFLFKHNSPSTNKKLTAENVMITAIRVATEQYDSIIRRFGLEYEYAPLYSIVIKAL